MLRRPARIPTLVEWVRIPDRAANAARGLALRHGRVQFWGTGFLNSSARDDALDVVGASRDDLSVGSCRSLVFFSLAMEISTLQAGLQRESISPLLYWKKMSVRQLLSPSLVRWLFFPAAREDSLNLALILNAMRSCLNDQTSMNCRPGFWAIRGGI